MGESGKKRQIAGAKLFKNFKVPHRHNNFHDDALH
jgi:hypothetical protein